MKRGRRLLLVLTVAAGFGAVGAIAWAYFSTPGAGSASAGVTALDAPIGVAASAAGTTVHVNWTGVTAPDGSATVAYWVQRYSGSTPTDACGSSHASPVAVGAGAKSCDDTGLASGTYTYTVTAVFRSWTAASTASSAVTVNAATLDHFTVSAPSTATAGTAFSVTVAAKDASNNTLSAYAGTVHLSTSDLNAPVLPGDYTFVSGDNGTHTFSNAVTLKTAGSQTVSVNDTVLTSKTGTSSTITVGGTTLDHFVVTGPSSASVANAFTTATTSARDVYNNPASGWTSATKCVAFSGPGSAPLGTAPSYPAQGSCAAGQSSLSFDASGQASGFSITLYKAETTSLTVTGLAKTGTSTTFTVSPGTATSFLVTAPSNATAGTPFTVTSLTARDAYNNVATAYAGAHTIAWTGAGNAPNGTAPTYPTTSVAFTAGVSTTTLNATFVKAESVTLTASETAGPSGSAPITVAAGSAANLLVSAPANATAGTSFTVTLTARDTFNNTATSYTGAHTIAWSGPSSAPNGAAPTLPATSVSFTSGVSTTTLTATLVKVESATLTASATSPTLVGSATISVSHGSASNFLVNAPASATAGTAFTVTSLTARDAFNNIATTYAGTHTIVWSGPATAPGGQAPSFPTTSVSFTNGVSTTTLNATLYKAETANLTATDASGPTGSGAITVTGLAAARLAWTHVTVSAGTLSSPCAFTCTDTALGNQGTFTANVTVTDIYGNPVSNLGAGHTVTVSTTASGGAFTLPTAGISVTLTIASSGVADSTAQFTFKTQNGNWGSDPLTAATLAGTAYTSATASVTKT